MIEPRFSNIQSKSLLFGPLTRSIKAQAGKCKPQKKATVYADKSTFNLGFSNPYSVAISKLAKSDRPVVGEGTNSSVIDVNAEPLQSLDLAIAHFAIQVKTRSNLLCVEQSHELASFLSNTRSDDEEETLASIANNHWFQNRFNDWLAFVNQSPLYEFF